MKVRRESSAVLQRRSMTIKLTLSLIRADAGLTGRFGLARTRDLRWGDVSKHHHAAGT